MRTTTTGLVAAATLALALTARLGELLAQPNPTQLAGAQDTTKVGVVDRGGHQVLGQP
ncbi:hypothetical protein AB4225_07025 [Streptomyces sp. 2RAF24]|uniref:hypothetical protein n=1 Tax=Streptomyces sp. 2RAF24 TaxID=3232997 RepID=UPI003F952156